MRSFEDKNKELSVPGNQRRFPEADSVSVQATPFIPLWRSISPLSFIPDWLDWIDYSRFPKKNNRFLTPNRKKKSIFWPKIEEKNEIFPKKIDFLHQKSIFDPKIEENRICRIDVTKT